MAQISFFFFLTLNFIFNVKLLALYLNCENRVNVDRSGTHYYCHQIGSHILTIEQHNSECCTLDLHFRCQPFLNVNILETLRASAKLRYRPYNTYRLILAIKWLDCECCTPWWPKFSRSIIWNLNISEKARASAKCVIYHLQNFELPIEWRHCECFTSWPWPKFSRSQT